MNDMIREQMPADAFFAHVARHPDARFDFIDGELVEVPPRPLHGYIQAQLTILPGRMRRASSTPASFNCVDG